MHDVSVDVYDKSSDWIEYEFLTHRLTRHGEGSGVGCKLTAETTCIVGLVLIIEDIVLTHIIGLEIYQNTARRRLINEVHGTSHNLTISGVEER
jgi:hypothetical protein